MIDIGLYVALGFLLASLLALMVAPAFWRRAVRLTRRRVEVTMPMSASDIQADKDQLRAEFAIELRRVEVGLEKAKDKAARELVEANKRRVEISEIKTELEGTRGRLQEKDNANRVLEQTIRRRLPELEGRLKAAKEAMAELEAANNELRNTAGSQAEALKLARSTLNTQRGDIDQLRGALEGDAAPSRRSSKSDATTRQGKSQAERRAVEAQEGADRRTDRRQRERVVARGTRQACKSRPRRCQVSKARRSPTLHPSRRGRPRSRCRASARSSKSRPFSAGTAATAQPMRARHPSRSAQGACRTSHRSLRQSGGGGSRRCRRRGRTRGDGSARKTPLLAQGEAPRRPRAPDGKPERALERISRPNCPTAKPAPRRRLAAISVIRLRAVAPSACR